MKDPGMRKFLESIEEKYRKYIPSSVKKTFQEDTDAVVSDKKESSTVPREIP